MRVFVTGASGNVGAALVPELLTAGHTVVGLARSDAAAEIVRSRGGLVVRGALDDLDLLSAAARAADGVIHLAFEHDEQHSGNLVAAAASDLQAVQAIGAALGGSGKPFVSTNATCAFALAGFEGLLTEHDTLTAGWRIEAENEVIGLAEHGVRSSVIRLPPTVHGEGEFGLASVLVQTASAAGVSGYLGNGSNVWPSADMRDVAVLYRLALESAVAGSRLHAVAEPGISLLEIAALIGRHLAIPVRSIAAEDSERHFRHVNAFVGLDNPTSSLVTSEALGWKPAYPGFLADFDHESNFEVE
ncbi:3-beta hydroxysteroid dehydrogenase [Lentzea guizhouensis]|uniref:3-beta hydroxysteroid dehydrogenase n=1 Tax=Lentzea guizhouensis TaxID=1586287 RepID=A0A1B2HT82_9PSEU|nr:SDR family oxidoreductase [Lentzea guizhouensis]ANZ40908.1 3-beta hydroxysteroid dehydrogenase [Lentzea guizhouensis]